MSSAYDHIPPEHRAAAQKEYDMRPELCNSSVYTPAADNYENAFVTSLACVLTHLVSLPSIHGTEKFTRFHAVKVPTISIIDYLRRLQKYFACSAECFVLGLVYIDRIIKHHPEFVVSQFNVHRLVVTAVMLAAKFFDDLYYSNAYYAKVGGVKTTELNALEVSFLKMIEWRLFVTPEEFEQYKNHVLMAVSGNNTKQVDQANRTSSIPPEEGD